MYLIECLMNSPSALLKSALNSEFHLFIDNSCETGGVSVAPPHIPQRKQRQSRNHHIWRARHSTYGHWRQVWFSYRARGCLGLSHVFVLNDVMSRARTHPCPQSASSEGREKAEFVILVRLMLRFLRPLHYCFFTQRSKTLPFRYDTLYDTDVADFTAEQK